VKGQSVELVPFADDEDFALLAEWSASPAASYGQGAPRFRTLDEVKASVGKPGSGNLLVRTMDGRKIGMVEWQQQAYTNSFTVGVIIGDPSLWGQGYGFESVSMLVEMLFHAFNAHRVQMATGLFNRSMVEILTRGFIRVEGVLRDYFFLDGEYHDMLIGSILRREYYAMRESGSLGPTDVIPATDKQEARQLLEKYLADHPIGG
jgi:RimJ/RimL family protein N-acetyltransferase